MVLAVAALLAASADDLTILVVALIVNGFTRFVSSGLSAALPDVVPRKQVVTMNSVATATGGAAAFLGASFMLVAALAVRCRRHRRCRNHFDRRAAGRARAAGCRCASRRTSSGHTTASERFTARCLRGGHRLAARHPHGAAPCRRSRPPSTGLAAHRMVFGINTLLVLVMVRHSDTEAVAGLGPPRCCSSRPPGSARFLRPLWTPGLVAPVGPLRRA